jgi:ABC-type Na+ efflux pump permease subunit
MTALPLARRELEAEARRGFNYWLRVLGAGSVVAAFAITSLNLEVVPSRFGPFLFRALNSALSTAIWVLVPVLTADCISSEKREGTLGLLFLTPLTSRDIVLGKAMIHALRAATILVAALPILALPLILGGVGWLWTPRAALSHVASLLLALAAGLMASVGNSERTRAYVTAELFSALFFAISLFGQLLWRALGFWNILGGLTIVWLIAYARKQRQDSVGIGADFGRGMVAPVNQWGASGPPWLLYVVAALLVAPAYLAGDWFGATEVFVALAVLLLVVVTSARKLERSWQLELSAPPQPEWVKIFSSSEFWRTLFHWNKSRTLDRNPIAWLQEYSWTARLTKWGWCVLMLASEVVVVLSGYRFTFYQKVITAVIMVGLAFSASASFRRERQNGALELLLVAPLRPEQLIGGRLWGIWGQFLPAVSILYSCWLLAPYPATETSRLWQLFGLSSYMLVPVIGLRFSVSHLNFLVAWLATCALGLLVPWEAQLVWAHQGLAVFVILLVQATIATMALMQLYRSFCRREPTYQPTMP